MHYLSLPTLVSILIIIFFANPAYSQLEKEACLPETQRNDFLQILDSLFSFPCDLDAINPLPTLFIHGENHENGQDISFKNDLIRQVKNGTIHLALENVTFGRSENRKYFKNAFEVDIEGRQIEGLDDLYVHSLGNVGVKFYYLFSAFYNIDNEGKNLDQHKFKFLYNFLDNPFIEEAWRNMNRPFKNSHEEELAKFIDEILSPGFNDALIRKIQWTIQWRVNMAFVNLSKALAEEFGKLAVKKYKDIHKVPDLSPFFALLENPENRKNLELYMEKILVKWRNQSIARNLMSAYCVAANAGKDLHVVVGRNHVDHLAEIVQETATDSHLKLNIVVEK